MLRSIFVGSSAILLAASLSGCATPSTSGQSAEVKEARDAPVYRTGSNLPVKDPSARSDVGTMSGESYKDQAQPALVRPILPPTPSGR